MGAPTHKPVVDDIYLFGAGDQTGPHTLTELRARFQKGEIPPDALGWWGNVEEWRPLNDLPGLTSPIMTVPSPLPAPDQVRMPSSERQTSTPPKATPPVGVSQIPELDPPRQSIWTVDLGLFRSPTIIIFAIVTGMITLFLTDDWRKVRFAAVGVYGIGCVLGAIRRGGKLPGT